MPVSLESQHVFIFLRVKVLSPRYFCSGYYFFFFYGKTQYKIFLIAILIMIQVYFIKANHNDNNNNNKPPFSTFKLISLHRDLWDLSHFPRLVPDIVHMLFRDDQK